MAITVLNQGNVPLGPFTRAQVAEKLQSGEFSLDSLAFVEGLSQWTPLRDVLAKVDATLPPVPPVVPPVVSPAGYSYAATMQPPSHLVYAGFWLRFAAYLIDSIIVGIPIAMIVSIGAMFLGGFAALAGAFNHSSRFDDSSGGVIVPVGIVFGELTFAVTVTVIVWLYFALQESGPYQGTFGKRALNVKVTNMAGERLTFGHATGRFFSKVITKLIPFGIGYMMAGFTARKQALHDLIAGTLVIRG